MTIRFTCAGCGSLLKIKDDLAGTDGKCPKCKTEFVVPEPAAETDSEFEVETSGAPAKARSSTKKAVEKVAEKPPENADSQFEMETSGAAAEARSTIKKVVEKVAEKPPENADSWFEVETSGEPTEAENAAEKPPEKLVEKSREKGVEKTAGKPAAKAKKAAAASDDFDPADFLMGGDDAPPRRSTTPVAQTVDPDEDDRRMGATSRPKKLSKPPTPGGAADGVSASAHAKEMMMKAMDDSRAHAGDAPAEETRAGIDWAGYFREYGLKGGAAILFGLVLTYGLYMFFDRLMGSSLKLPKLGYVSGEVKLDGNPLPGATVYFAPREISEIPGAKKERPRTSFGITDAKGHYTMIYIERTQGVAAGKCRVWLDLIGPKGQMIPPNYTEAVMTERLVKPGRNEPMNFDMKSTP